MIRLANNEAGRLYPPTAAVKNAWKHPSNDIYDFILSHVATGTYAVVHCLTVYVKK